MSARKKKAAKKVSTKAAPTAPTAPAESVVVRKSQMSAAQYIADAIASLKGEADVLVFGIDESSQKHQHSNAGRVFFIESDARLIRDSRLLSVQQVEFMKNNNNPPSSYIYKNFGSLLSTLAPSFSLVVLNPNLQTDKGYFYAFKTAGENSCKLIINGLVSKNQLEWVDLSAEMDNYEITETRTDLTVWTPKQN